MRRLKLIPLSKKGPKDYVTSGHTGEVFVYKLCVAIPSWPFIVTTDLRRVILTINNRIHKYFIQLINLCLCRSIIPSFTPIFLPPILTYDKNLINQIQSINQLKRQSIQFFAHSRILVNPHIFHHAPLDLSRISISPTESTKSAGLTNQPTHQQLICLKQSINEMGLNYFRILYIRLTKQWICMWLPIRVAVSITMHHKQLAQDKRLIIMLHTTLRWDGLWL